MRENDSQILRDIYRELREIKSWTRFSAMLSLKRILQETLMTDPERRIYELSDGKRSTRDISRMVGVSHVTIANLWKKWAALGIVEPSEKYVGRYQRITKLSEVGMEIPKVTEPRTVTESYDTYETSHGSIE